MEVALLYTLRHNAFLHAVAREGGTELVLQGEPLADLHCFLEFLTKLLPRSLVSEDIASLVAVVRTAQVETGFLAETAWLKVLDDQGIDQAPPEAGKNPQKYWRVCSTYTCGLWILFHLVTVVSSELSTLPPNEAKEFLVTKRRPTPKYALLMMRLFVKRFFGCETCVSHFSNMFDNCIFDHCKLDEADGCGVVMWLWRIHNNVTARVADESGVSRPPPWPPYSECSGCWTDSKENGPLLYAHLKRTYLLSDWAVENMTPRSVHNWAWISVICNALRSPWMCILLITSLLLVIFLLKSRSHVEGLRDRHGRIKNS